MDSSKETGSEKADSSLWLHNSKNLAEILTEINQNIQSMLRLIKDGEPDSKEKFLGLYQSLGERYNDLNQQLLNGLLNFDIKLSFSDRNDASSSLVTPMADLSSFHSDASPSLESGSCNSHYPVSPGRKTTSREMVPSLKQKREVEKNESAYLLADIFRGELETALGELEAEKRRVVESESKVSDSRCKIEKLESELEECKECLAVSEIEASKLSEMLSECRTEKDNGGDLLDSLRAELRLSEIQIEQMEECLNQVCVKDTELASESGTNKNVSEEEELRGRVEELEKQVELQRNVIKEREEEKREAIRELCFSVDHYKSRYIELVRSLSGNNN